MQDKTMHDKTRQEKRREEKKRGREEKGREEKRREKKGREAKRIEEKGSGEKKCPDPLNEMFNGCLVVRRLHNTFRINTIGKRDQQSQQQQTDPDETNWPTTKRKCLMAV